MNTHALVPMIVILSAATALMSGCGTLHQKLQGSRFDTPETNGEKRRFKVQAVAAAAADVTIVPAASVRPPDFTHPSADDTTEVGLDASVGLMDRLDIGVKLNEPSMFTVKLQLAGPSQGDAKEGDVSLAVMAGLGSGSMSTSATESAIGSGSYAWNGSLKTKATDIAIIAGYRASNRVLLYGSGFYTNYAFDTTIDQQQSYDGSMPAASYSQSTSGYQRGGNIGAQIYFGASPVYMMAEGVYTDVRTGNLQHNYLRAGFAFGASF